MSLFNTVIKINDDQLHDYPQAITSANTSVRIIPHGTKFIAKAYPAQTRVIDFGGGKFDNAKEYLSEFQIDCEVYDPYNRTPIENNLVVHQKYDILLCNNVLNTLTDDVMEKAILDMAIIYKNCEIKTGFITIYERDRNGIGLLTKAGQYQRNEITKNYLIPLQKYFKLVILEKKLIRIKGLK